MSVKTIDSHLNLALVAELRGAIIGAQTPAALTSANKAGAFGYDTATGFLIARGASATRSIPWENATPASEFIMNSTAATLADRKGLVITANGIYAKNGNDALVPFLAGNLIAAGSLQSIDVTNGNRYSIKASTLTGASDYTIEAPASLPTAKSVRFVSTTGVETFEALPAGVPTFANDAARIAASFEGIWQDPNHNLFRAATTAGTSLRQITTDDIANAMDWRGTFNATPGQRPDQAGVTNIQAGDLWIITGAGTLTGIEGSDVLAVGDFLIATTNNPTTAAGYAGIETNTTLNLTNYLAWENQTVNLAGSPVVATFTTLTTVRGAECYDSTGLRRDSLNVRIASATTVEVDGLTTIANLRVLGYGVA
jgi:hypothetical protein